MITLDGIPSSTELFDKLAEDQTPVILNFSRGKDSIVVWLELEKRGIRPQAAIHKSAVPGLKFVADDLARFEDRFQQKIIDLPSQGFFRRLANNVYQPPERCAILEGAGAALANYSRDEWDNIIRHVYGTPESWFLDGVRATDSATRRMAIMRYGPVKQKMQRMSPIWDFGIQDVRDSLDAGNITLGPDYEWFGRSLDGLRWDYLKPIYDNAPEDYQRIKAWFPLIDVVIQEGPHA